MWRAGLLLVALACGGPALQNVPAPNKNVAAGLAAGAATAATLADPDAATRQKEEGRSAPGDKRAVPSPMVPPDVLDRLDDAEKKKGKAPPPPAAPPASPPRDGGMFDGPPRENTPR